MEKLQITPVARIRSQFSGKFGIPRQPGLAPSLVADIVFEPEFRNPDFIRGLEGVSHLWLLWEFSEFRDKPYSALVRPPRLGGNKKLGVFATRSPLRPNPLALSAVKIEGIANDEKLGNIIKVSGADLMDGTPIYDIKPYIPYTDCISEAYTTLYPKPEILENVVYNCDIPPSTAKNTLKALEEILLQDPRPAYKKEDTGIYKFEFGELHVEFYVNGKTVFITSLACCNSSLVKSLTPSNG